MQCPNCNETLVMSERQGVEIDYCPKCRGVWLDRGELDKIIDKSQSELPPQQPGYSQDSYKDRDYKSGYGDQGYKRKKKGGFLSDMFDFD